MGMFDDLRICRLWFDDTVFEYQTKITDWYDGPLMFTEENDGFDLLLYTDYPCEDKFPCEWNIIYSMAPGLKDREGWYNLGSYEEMCLARGDVGIFVTNDYENFHYLTDMTAQELIDLTKMDLQESRKNDES